MSIRQSETLRQLRRIYPQCWLMRQENSSENTIHYICTAFSCLKRPSSFAAVKIQAWNQLVVMKTACPHRIRTPCARRSPGKKGAFFPGTLARPRPATEAPQRKGKASLALRRASRALALRPLSAAGRTRDAWLREKCFWPSFSPKGGRERSVLASVQRTVPTQGRACLPRPMPAERLKKVSVFCLAK